MKAIFSTCSILIFMSFFIGLNSFAQGGLTIDESKIQLINPTSNKGNNGMIKIPVTGIYSNDEYLVSYTIISKTNESDTQVVKKNKENELVISNLAPGIYSNINISSGNSTIATINLSDTITLRYNYFVNKIGAQTASLSAATFYNYSGVTNDVPSGYIQYYISGSAPLRRKDGIDKDASVCRRLIYFRSVYFNVSYTNPNAFNLQTFDTLHNKYVNQLDLYSHANLNALAGLNLATFILPHSNFLGDDAHVYLNFNSGLLVTTIVDTQKLTSPNTYSIKSNLLGFSLAIKSTNFLNSKFQFQGNVNLFQVHQNSNSVDYRLGPQYGNLDDTSNAQNSSKNLFLQKKAITYFNFSLQFLYNLNGITQNSPSNIYVRYAYTTNYANINSKNYSNSFFQLQIGYLLDLGKVFYPQSPTAASSVSSVKSL